MKIKPTLIKIRKTIVTLLVILVPISLGLWLMFFPTDDTSYEMVRLHRFTFMIGLLLLFFVVKWTLKVYIYTKNEEDKNE